MLLLSINTLIDSLPMQVEGEGGDSLFNSKCQYCPSVDNDAMHFIPALGIHFRIANSFTRWRGIFKGL